MNKLYGILKNSKKVWGMPFSKRNENVILLIFLTIFATLIINIIIYGYQLLSKSVSIEISEDDKKLGIKKKIVEDNIDKGHDVANIVLLGIDGKGFFGNARSDSIIIVSLDRKNNSMKLTSILRDTYIHIPRKGMDKLGHAYAYGGSELAIKTINQNFNMDIKDFITVDFAGFEKIIDVIGGVEIELSPSEANYIKVDSSGKQLLNGEKALKYSRIRKIGNADYERTERQRIILEEAFKKIIVMNITEYPKLLDTFLPFVKTSLSKIQMLSLGIEIIRYKIKNIEQFRIPADGYAENKMINGISYIVPVTIEDNIMLLKNFLYGDENSILNN